MNNLIYYIIASCSLLLLSNELTAQQPITFERYYSDSGAVEGRRVRQKFDGGYIVAGRRNAFATFFSNDAILMKTDSMGDVEWLKVYGTRTGDDWFNDVQQTADSGYIACGYIPQSGMQDNIYVVKTDKYGDTLWTRAWGSGLADYASSITKTHDGGFALAGVWEDSMGIIIRLDSQGDTLWTQKLYDNYISLFSILETADSGFVAAGVLNANHLGLNLEVYVVRVDKNGNTLWEKNYGYSGADYGFCIKALPDGNLLVGGYTWLPPNDYDSYLIKLDGQGDTIWTKIYSDPRENGIVEIAINQEGGFAFAETKSVLGLGYQSAIFKTDSLGNFLWRKEFGGTGSEIVYGNTACLDNGFVITGLSDSHVGGISKLFLFKTNELGIISNIRFIADPTKNIKIYPNPFTEKLFIDSDLSDKNAEIIFYDIMGLELVRNPLSGNSLELEGKNLKNGILIYIIISDGVTLQNGKLLHIK